MKATHQVDKEIGTRVRLRRAQIGMSQAELGAALGVPFQQIQEYENGTDRISVSRLNQIAGTLGVDPAFFLPEPDGQDLPGLVSTGKDRS
jgi:transcriptional regulator with XRE-family HTH domain